MSGILCCQTCQKMDTNCECQQHFLDYTEYDEICTTKGPTAQIKTNRVDFGKVAVCKEYVKTVTIRDINNTYLIYEAWLLNNRTDAATSALQACRDNRTGDTFPTFSSVDKLTDPKIPVKLGKTFTEAYAVLKDVYGNECLSRTQVFEWFKRFKEGHETTEDDPRPGRPSTSKTNEFFENIENIG
ncbi:hypothetical protein NQ318_010455 [Aromia moschata]|uniref:Mos1 transposase HTH domain-containing protein n=1 Tax=Aromia moschata TaxID=1265417 RepID=A0AAV8YBI5_9CUCU|nr:hypothetical protein NQ318_010455 [Aromia moschata]